MQRNSARQTDRHPSFFSKKDSVLNVEQVRQRMNCSRRHVYNLISSGDLKAFTIGNKRGLRVSESDLNSFIKTRKKAFGA